MIFQDELNNMKKHPSDSESKLKSAADDVVKMVVSSLKSSASNCIAGTKLNCDFLCRA